MDRIKIYHKDWNDIIQLNINNNTVYRLSGNNDTGKYILKDNFLLIDWDKWDIEYFYSFNKFDYNLELDIPHIYLVYENFSNIFLIDNFRRENEMMESILFEEFNNSHKIYKKDNLEFYGNIIDSEFNKLTINKDGIITNFIYFNYKYYDSYYFNKLYEIIRITFPDSNQLTCDLPLPHMVEYYILSRENNICYKNYNILNKGTYYKYRNKIMFSTMCGRQSRTSPFDNLNESKIKIYKNGPENIFKNNESNINRYQFFILDNSVQDTNVNKDSIKISQIIDLIDYYLNFNVNVILFHNTKDIYDIYDNINFIYYDNYETLLNIINIQQDCIQDIVVPILVKTNNISNIRKILQLESPDSNQVIRGWNLLHIDESQDSSAITLDEKYIKNVWNDLNKDSVGYDYLFGINNKSPNKIPKIMHFIWIGNKQIPDIYLEYIESWINHHKDYVFCFWNDDNIPKLINQKYYDETDVMAMKADILRYELLYFFGGIYIDCDFLCIKNIDSIIEEYSGFSGYESDEYIAIGLMGFAQYDNILLNVILNISYNIICNPSFSVPKLTGPVFFTNIWNKFNTTQENKISKYYAFPINYFYSYTFEDKLNNKEYIINDDNYAIHMWGYSWNKLDKELEMKGFNINPYYVLKFYLSNLIKPLTNQVREKRDEVDYLKNTICYNCAHLVGKKKIVHIMGLFFTGGIERYLYYIDKYGNHDLYQYYLLYISNNMEGDASKMSPYVYKLKNMIMIPFDWNHEYLNKLLLWISPSLIIDHYSLYIKDNNEIYKNIYRKNILYFVHSAICYNNDISKLSIHKCINLYNYLQETRVVGFQLASPVEKIHPSWKNIYENYYVTLGTELLQLTSPDSRRENVMDDSKKINISIIGRIASEKIPLTFLKKLCVLSNKIFDKIEIHIYGEKDMKFNKDYVDDFELLINDPIGSKIIVHGFVDPLKISEIYLKTDILLIPSVYETGSFTCIEAFSYGIPVIARNVYGLKYMIKNNETGYLCDSDEDILDYINFIYNSGRANAMKESNQVVKTNFGFPRNPTTDVSGFQPSDVRLTSPAPGCDLIKTESLKYNIIDKIKDLENIIEKQLRDDGGECPIGIQRLASPDSNQVTCDLPLPHMVVIITSVLNCVSSPLSYYPVRSIFTLDERYKHTLNSIQSIRKHIPNVEILFCECSNLSENITVEDDIKNKVDYYFNFYDNIDIRNHVNSALKGLGETYILLEAIKILFNSRKTYTNMFKLSGRYYLNDNFNYELFNNSYNNFANWDNSITSYSTIFYKINMNDIISFQNALTNSIKDLENKNSIEQCIYKYFNRELEMKACITRLDSVNQRSLKKNINILEKINISGFLATEGYMFSM